MIDIKLILECQKSDRAAQRKVYDQLASSLYYTCKRYLKQEEEVEEALADAFYTIFTKINQLQVPEAFAGWARKIAVNQCLARLKKKNNFNLYLEDVSYNDEPMADIDTTIEEEDLLNLVEKIPEGCRTVFNLYVIEGYAHKEIAQMLSISEGTSKSQLNVAKTKLKVLVEQLYTQKIS